MTIARPLFLETFDATSSNFEPAVRLYAKTWGHAMPPSLAFIGRYAVDAGFRGRVAKLGSKVVGMGFGTDAYSGNWWYDKVCEEIGLHPLLTDAWVLVELCVQAKVRGQGIGSLLIDNLFAGVRKPHILLSTQVSNNGARRLYERIGFHYLSDGMIFADGQSPYVVMVKQNS